MSRATNLNVAPNASDVVGTVIVLVVVLVVEAAIDAWTAHPAQPAIDVETCVWVCEGWVQSYSSAGCLCHFPAPDADAVTP